MKTFNCPERCCHRVHPEGEPDSDKCRYYIERQCTSMDKRRMDNLTPEQREIVEKTMEGIYTRLKADIDADATYSGD